jgi:hypothetical protein
VGAELGGGLLLQPGDFVSAEKNYQELFQIYPGRAIWLIKPAFGRAIGPGEPGTKDATTTL